MKLSNAWAAIAAQNVTLKGITLLLGVVTLALLGTCLKLALKPPLIIERGCYNSIAKLGSSRERTVEEIEAFIKIALSQRFNSGEAVHPIFLSSDEESARLLEQKELLQRDMSQTTVIHSVQVEGEKITIDADRLISVGSIRSALAFPLQATVSSQSRTEINPYGLVLSKVISLKTEESK